MKLGPDNDLCNKSINKEKSLIIKILSLLLTAYNIENSEVFFQNNMAYDLAYKIFVIPNSPILYYYA